MDAVGKHIKAFASETISAITALGCFSDLVLAPSGRLPAIKDALDKGRRVQDMLRMCDSVINVIDELENAMAAFHAAFVATMPEAVKQKPHLMRHVVDSIRHMQKNFNCFVTERKHKSGKSICPFTYKECFKPMAAHDIHQLRLHFSNPNSYLPTALQEKVALEGLAPLFQSCGLAVSTVYGSRRVRTVRGDFARGEVLAHRQVAG